MTNSRDIPSDVAFTPAVKAVQARLGSRSAYARMEASGGWETEVDEALAAFIARQRSFFLATAAADGQPYIQHRGGPPGFLKVLGPRTLGFADLRGNRQYISVGNLSENAKVHLFLIDYEERARVKIWGEARVVEDDPALLASLVTAERGAKAERALLIDVVAWDANCPQHIPQRLEAEHVARALATRDAKIAALEAELAALRGAPGAGRR
jgi:predicted pyridoxine 5'-phosphate oxidase superfamily flavin-nucleotide-binding protein